VKEEKNMLEWPFSPIRARLSPKRSKRFVHNFGFRVPLLVTLLSNIQKTK